MKYNKINGLLLIGFFSVLTPLSAANAANIVVNYSGSTVLNGQAVGYESGYIAPNPSSSQSLKGVGIGGDSLTTSDTGYLFSSAGVFNAWCVDIYHWMSAGASTYNVETGNELAGLLTGLRPGTPDGAARVEDLIDLANEVYSTLATKIDSAAFQLAVWAITYGTPDANGVYKISTTDPGFHVDNVTAVSQYVTLANQWLSDLDSAISTGSYVLTYLSDARATRSTQNLVVFTPTVLSSSLQIATVPEPGSLALILLGLALFGSEKGKKLNHCIFS